MPITALESVPRTTIVDFRSWFCASHFVGSTKNTNKIVTVTASRSGHLPTQSRLTNTTTLGTAVQ